MRTRRRIIVAVFAGSVGLLLSSTAAPASPPATRPIETRVMTFNVRYANTDDGPNYWPFRRELFIKTVRDFDPDLLGCQEVLATQQDDLAKAFADYGTVSAGRDDGKRSGEACSIFFRKSRYALRDSGTFWLSKTPERVGSKGWDAALPRVCTWATLYDRQTDREIVIFNTHFDHAGDTARTKSAELLAARLPKIAGDRPMILTGDLNCNEDSSAYAAVAKANGATAGFADVFRVCRPKRRPDEASFHAFKGDVHGTRIDFVFASPHWQAVSCAIDRATSPAGRWPSDHFAIAAVVALR